MYVNFYHYFQIWVNRNPSSSFAEEGPTGLVTDESPKIPANKEGPAGRATEKGPAETTVKESPQTQ